MKRAFTGMFDIPKVIQLPGCRVRVRVVPESEFDGHLTYSHDEQNMTIRIDGRLPIEVQRYTLLHELLHALHDALDIMLEKYPRAVATKHTMKLYRACAAQNEEICQTLGKALGYPWFKDDQKNFPGATEADGVCVGEHVAETIAAEAAARIQRHEHDQLECGG